MLTPEEIAERRFLVSLRGYDRDEVHAFLADLAHQVGQLQQRNAELSAEAERVAGAAEGAPAEPDVPTGPGSEAGAGTPDRPFAQLGEETQRILEAAEEAAAQITRKAKRDADRELQAARQQAAKLIADGERRREALEEVVGRFEERRAAIAGELREVGQTIDRAVAELVPEGEAPTVREALAATLEQAEARDDAGAAAEGLPDTAAHPAAGDRAKAAPDHANEREPADEPELADSAELADAAELTDELESAREPGFALVTGDHPEPVEREELNDTGGVLPDEAADDAVAAASAEATEELELDPAAVPEASGLEEQSAAPVVDAPAEDERVEAPAEDERVEAPAEEAPVQDSIADEAAEAPEAPEAAEAAEEPETAEAAEEPESEEPAGPGALRAAALDPLHPKMVRRLKRGLSDLQNISLDRLRREGEKAEATDLEITDDELTALGEVADSFLQKAYQAGVDAAGVLAGRSLPAPNEPRPLADEFVGDGGGRIRQPLAATLRMGLGAKESVTALNDRVGAVFSELKRAAADELSATHLIRAYELGLLDAWEAGGVTHRIWVLGREPRCPEGRCRQNDQSGAVEVSEPFPSGHVAPPVHVGCTCTTIPSLES